MYGATDLRLFVVQRYLKSSEVHLAADTKMVIRHSPIGTLRIGNSTYTLYTTIHHTVV